MCPGTETAIPGGRLVADQHCNIGFGGGKDFRQLGNGAPALGVASTPDLERDLLREPFVAALGQQLLESPGTPAIVMRHA
jgi:hypothetical protein